MCMNVLPACMYVDHMCSWSLKRPQGFRAFGAGIPGGCELSCGWLKPNLGPLKEQRVLLSPIVNCIS